MSQNNKNTNETDKTEDVMSWVIIFILMFAFPPAGLVMLLLKVRSYAKPGSSGGSSASSGAADDWRNTASAAQNAAQKAANQAKDAAAQASSQASSTAQDAINKASVVAQNAIKEASAAAQAALKDAGITWQTSETGNQQTSSQQAQQATNQQTHNQRPAQQTAPQQPQRKAAPTAYGSARPAPQTSGYARPTGQAKQKPAKETKDTSDGNVLEKKSGKAISIILLFIAIALFIIGANTVVSAATGIWGAGLVARWPEFWLGIFYFLGGFISLFSRNIVTKRLGRFKAYYAYIAGRDVVPMQSIANTSGLKIKTVRRDIQKMIDEGYFETGTYIDNELDSLILCGNSAEELRKTVFNTDDTTQDEDTGEKSYAQIIAELHTLNTSVADITISGKIERIEFLTAKIFRIVEEHPEKKSQIRRFETYYLPTTMKLVRQYSTLEKQGVKGENIMAAKQNIGRVLDTLATGYEQQLDQLFSSDAMDIAADITVLENLMQQDGLAKDEADFKTMTG